MNAVALFLLHFVFPVSYFDLSPNRELVQGDKACTHFRNTAKLHRDIVFDDRLPELLLLVGSRFETSNPNRS